MQLIEGVEIEQQGSQVAIRFLTGETQRRSNSSCAANTMHGLLPLTVPHGCLL